MPSPVFPEARMISERLQNGEIVFMAGDRISAQAENRTFEADFLGQKVQFPERRKIYKTLEKVFIYNYCKAHNFSESSYLFMAKQYNKRIPQTRAIVNTMQRFIDAKTNEGFEDEDFEGEDQDE